MIRLLLRVTFKAARQIVVLIIGLTIVVIGIVMIFTPGPATVVIPAGLAVLAIEFAWAKRWLSTLKRYATTAVSMFNGKVSSASARSTQPSAPPRPTEDTRHSPDEKRFPA